MLVLDLADIIMEGNLCEREREGVRIIDKNVAGYLGANSLSKLIN
jgi:hypothetical protein